MSLAAMSDKLAEIGANIAPESLSRVESGQRRVDVDDLLAIAMVLDVPPSYLLLGDWMEGQALPVTDQAELSREKYEAWTTGRRDARVRVAGISASASVPEPHVRTDASPQGGGVSAAAGLPETATSRRDVADFYPFRPAGLPGLIVASDQFRQMASEVMGVRSKVQQLEAMLREMGVVTGPDGRVLGAFAPDEPEGGDDGER